MRNSISLLAAFQKAARANKVVSMSELKDKTAKEYESSLNITDKTYLYLWEKPVSVLSGIKGTFSIVTSPNKKSVINRGAYKYKGIEKPAMKDLFFSGNAFSTMMEASSASFRKSSGGIQGKINAAFLRAWDNCDDYAPQVKKSEIVPHYMFP